jgi:hypothetical protein
MSELCPQCAHDLYGYEACNHSFVNGRCIRCHWDGSGTGFLRPPRAELVNATWQQTLTLPPPIG